MARMVRPNRNVRRHWATHLPAPDSLNRRQREALTLPPPETTLRVLRRSIKHVICSSVAFFILLVLILIPLAVLSGLPAVIAVFGLVVMMGFALATIVNWLGHVYVITSDRIIESRGLFAVSTHEMRMAHVYSLTVVRGVLGSLLEYGTVMLSSAATAGAEIVLYNVDMPQSIRSELELLRQTITHQATATTRPNDIPAPKV